MKENKVLSQTLIMAQEIVDGKTINIIPDSMTKKVNFMVSKIGSNKSLVSALVTSFLKKIINPQQDIRLHRTDFVNGYSARSLDTAYTSPFFKRHFPKYANKESSFLTLATRERIKWTKTDGKNLKIRNKELKATFIEILDEIENGNQTPNNYLMGFFVALINLSKNDEQVFEYAKNRDIKKGSIKY